MGRPRSLRFSSLFSEDEFGEDHPDAAPAKYELGCNAVCRGHVCVHLVTRCVHV